MAQPPDSNLPKVFISHAWEDKPFVHRLETELKALGVEMWVDHSNVRAGDLITIRVDAALKWCDTLLLVWSKTAKKSDWVSHEWGAAFANHKKIIQLRPGMESQNDHVCYHVIALDFQSSAHVRLGHLVPTLVWAFSHLWAVKP